MKPSAFLSTLLSLLLLAGTSCLTISGLFGCSKKIVHRPKSTHTRTVSKPQHPTNPTSGQQPAQEVWQKNRQLVPKPSKKRPKSYTVMGQTYTPLHHADNYSETGIASWYGKKFHGRLTASGEVYNMYGRTAAHRILPMHTWIVVTNLDNNKTIRVRVNDRGPFVKNRILDLSYQAAKDLGVVGPGTAHVRIEAENTSREAVTGPFYIQVGSFTVQENASKLCQTLCKQGYTKSRLNAIALHGQPYWQVHAGTFATMPQAKQAMEELSVRFPSCFILAD